MSGDPALIYSFGDLRIIHRIIFTDDNVFCIYAI